MPRISRPSSRVLVLLALLLPALSWAQGMRFTTLDIGQGDAAVLIAPGGCVALFDGGPTGKGAIIKAYLKSLGVTRVNMAFISHMHADHMGAIDEVDVGTNAIPIDAVYDHGGTYNSSAYDDYASHFAGRRFTVTRGQTFSLCGEVTLTVVAVNGNGITHDDENSKSVAVKITYGAFDALVGGDLTGRAPNIESTLIADVGDLELYKVHHHGSRDSSTDSMLDALNPTVSFISVGWDNTYGHPTVECLTRLSAHGSDVWMTEDPAAGAERGHIELSTLDGNTFEVKQGIQTSAYISKGGDLEPPSVPGALSATLSASTQVDLGWSASTDNLGVARYRVYRNVNGGAFSLAGTSTVTGFADMGLIPGATYTYRVTAVDWVGNESPFASVSVRLFGPRITLTLTSPNGGERWTKGSVHSLTWASSGLANVKLEYSLDNGTTWTPIVSGVAASLRTYAWTTPATLSNTVRVRVSDPTNTFWDMSDAPFTLAEPAAPAKVILNEILANEPGSSVDGEFVELVNVGGTDIDISGWVIRDASAVQHVFAFGTTLGAGRSIVVFGGPGGIPPGTPNAVAASTGGLSLNNSGDTVTVRVSSAASATLIDTFTYTSTLAGQDGVSMNRSPDTTASASFVLHNTLSSLKASPGVRVTGAPF